MRESRDSDWFLVNTQVQSHALLRRGFGTSVPFIHEALIATSYDCAYHWLLASNLPWVKPVYVGTITTGMFLIHSKSNVQYCINSLHVEMDCIRKQMYLLEVIICGFTSLFTSYSLGTYRLDICIQLISKLSKGSIPTLSENWRPFAPGLKRNLSV